MPSIRIKNNLGIDILGTDAGPGSGISKYFKGDVAGFVASSELATALNKSIATIAPQPLGLGLTFAQDGTFGTSGADWHIAAGAKVLVNATQEGSAIPGDKPFSTPIVVDDGKTFVSVSFNPTLAVDFGAGAGDLKFGFSAGGAVEFRAGRFYDVAAQAPTLAASLKDLLTTGVVPGDVADLGQMRAGDVASVSGSGKLKFSATFDVARAMNPLATPTLGLEAIGALKLEAGASLSVGASVGISGRYQIRVLKVSDGAVRVGVFKMAGSQLQFDVKASAGVSASLGKRELTEKLMGFLGAAKVDVPDLVDAGLSDAQIAAIKGAIEASLSRSLELSLAGSFATSMEETTIFEYDFELARLDAAGSDALQGALEGDVSLLTSRRSDELPAGVRLRQSELDTVRKQSVTWKINLFGLVNVLRVTTLVQSGKVLFDPETGDLLVTDSATAESIVVDTRSLAADAEKLRHAMMQSAVLTAAYRASGVQKFLEFKGSVSYFEQVSNVERQKASDFLDNLAGLNLIGPEEKAGFLANTLSGRASVYVEAAFGSPSFEGMFTDGAGEARRQDHYDAIGRAAMAQLIQPGDANDFRRIPMAPENDALWRDMTSAGPFNLQNVLPEGLNRGARLKRISDDYVIVRWWSKAMSTAAERVVDMRAFLKRNGDDPEALRNDKEFKKRRAALADALADVVKQAHPDFVDAWGVLAMYGAAQRIADVRGFVITAGPIMAESRVASLAAGQ